MSVADRPREAGRALARSPAWRLVIGGAALALAFPARMPGAIGLAVLPGAAGVGDRARSARHAGAPRGAILGHSGGAPCAAVTR